MSTTEIWLSLLGMAALTVITRGFFLLPKRELPMPGWLREALRYAPLAALVAVVAPEVVMTDGVLISTWQEPRVFGALAGAVWFVRTRGILGTIVCGTAVMLLLHLGLGWGAA